MRRFYRNINVRAIPLLSFLLPRKTLPLPFIVADMFSVLVSCSSVALDVCNFYIWIFHKLSNPRILIYDLLELLWIQIVKFLWKPVSVKERDILRARRRGATMVRHFRDFYWMDGISI